MRFTIDRVSLYKDKPCQESSQDAEGNWFVEIDSLDELVNLYNKYGDLIICEDYRDKGKIQIIIYDDYIE